MNSFERRSDVGLSVSEDEHGYKVSAVLPGLDVGKLDISVLERQLKISGEFARQELPEGARWHRQERSQGAFERVLRVAQPLDADKVEAEYRNGILEIRLPKAESALPKKIAVNVAG
jgi:HSP20 family protein